MTSNDFTSIDVFCALDIGKSAHHGTALLADGRTTFDKALPNGEPQLRELFARLKRKGKVLVVVDQPASIGTLAVTVARACGCEVAYLPGLSMRRLADLHPGTGKTDARDAYVIADAARTMPHLLHSIDPDESVRAELTMVLGHDDDLAQDATRTSNRLRGLLTSIHPALERVLGPRLRHPAVLALLQAYGSPAQLAQAGTEQIAQVMLQAAPRMRSAHTLADQITTALAEQTVRVPGTGSAGEIVSGLAEALAVLLKRRDILEMRVAALLEAHPLAKGLTSMPGVAVRTGARILAEVGGRRVDVLHAMLKHRTLYQPGHEQTA
ncbi:IS110 family transposase [Streptomyces ferrugineus]|uniref:IS110 family transposase n=1 Tax=Streptomyces ferrugineus TaxID=1413221 RepID=A0A7M2SDG2_9ACTN|nr:IS110 family transposase [Streptomyces ferrugineus]